MNCMKRIDSWLILVSRRLIMLLSMVLSLIGILMLLSATVGLPEFMKNKSFLFFVIPDLQKEISLDATIWADIPDSSIAVDIADVKTVVNYSPGLTLNQEAKKIITADNVYKDTIRTAMANGKPGWNFKRLSLRTGKLDLEPSGFSQRIVLATPGILWYLVVAFIFWQLAVIMKAVSRKDYFAPHVYKKVAWIGWAVVIFQIICILFDNINGSFHSVSLDVISSIPHYRAPFTIYGMPAAGYSITWLFTGAVILIFARAFKYGYFLQDEYDHQL